MLEINKTIKRGHLYTLRFKHIIDHETNVSGITITSLQIISCLNLLLQGPQHVLRVYIAVVKMIGYISFYPSPLAANRERTS